MDTLKNKSLILDPSKIHIQNQVVILHPKRKRVLRKPERILKNEKRLLKKSRKMKKENKNIKNDKKQSKPTNLKRPTDIKY